MQNYTREQVMTASVIKHIAHKKHAQAVKADRQKQQKRIVAQDCYGVQKRGEKIGQST